MTVNCMPVNHNDNTVNKTKLFEYILRNNSVC